MNSINRSSLADMLLQLSWSSSLSRHTDCLMASGINLWRDVLPLSLAQQVHGRETGDTVELSISPGELIPLAGPQDRIWLRRTRFKPHGHPYQQPRSGRFYPKGWLSGLTGVFRQNITPFRCTGIENGRIGVDLSNPLADRDLTLKATVGGFSEKRSERGGTCTDWFEKLTDGPGMQARWNNKPTDFFSRLAFGRDDPTDDHHFYEKPRFVQHIDSAAADVVNHINARFLKDGMRVLDLMSSWVTHLPSSSRNSSISGLGLNAQELAANQMLTDHVVHDLNRQPRLPYEDQMFDLVLCSLSVEYLTHPVEVFRDVSRVLKPLGRFVVTFSNRWFPPKAIHIWKELHEFERLGWLLEIFDRSVGFRDFHSFSMRELPRPVDDKYYPAKHHADPIYAAWATRSR